MRRGAGTDPSAVRARRRSRSPLPKPPWRRTETPSCCDGRRSCRRADPSPSSGPSTSTTRRSSSPPPDRRRGLSPPSPRTRALPAGWRRRPPISRHSASPCPTIRTTRSTPQEPPGSSLSSVGTRSGQPASPSRSTPTWRPRRCGCWPGSRAPGTTPRRPRLRARSRMSCAAAPCRCRTRACTCRRSTTARWMRPRSGSVCSPTPTPRACPSERCGHCSRHFAPR